MAIEVFNRYEKKYRLTRAEYEEIIELISDHMEADKYSRGRDFYSICNIYYDTEDDLLIRRSIEKPVYKEKLRLRSYGIKGEDDEVFVEIKKKFKGVVNKRRTAMTLKEAKDYLDRDITPEGEGINRQVLREIDYFKNIYRIRPKVFLAYDRRAYFDREDKNFRITFDTNIRARREEPDLKNGDYGRLITEPEFWLMEVKMSGAMPLWFTQILSRLKIYPVSFSKYGTEYTQYINNLISKGEKTACLSQSLPQQKQQFQPVQQF